MKNKEIIIIKEASPEEESISQRELNKLEIDKKVERILLSESFQAKKEAVATNLKKTTKQNKRKKIVSVRFEPEIFILLEHIVAKGNVGISQTVETMVKKGFEISTEKIEKK